MKTLNTLIISSLLAVSVVTPAAAFDLSEQTKEMNRLLDRQIERQTLNSMQVKATHPSQRILVSVPAVQAKASNSKVSRTNS